MYKQIIIVRKDLQMSPGKLSAQVSHGSMAFISNCIKTNVRMHTVEDKIPAIDYSIENGYVVQRPKMYRRDDLSRWSEEAFQRGDSYFYVKPVDLKFPNGKLELCQPTYKFICHMDIDKDIYEQWFNDSFTKVVLEAKNLNHLLKAKTFAESLGMNEREDFFFIYDACKTELEPEIIDENGVGRTLTCIGFKPMDSNIIDQIGKKYQLYK